jgi:hypothetical protein
MLTITDYFCKLFTIVDVHTTQMRDTIRVKQESRADKEAWLDQREGMGL